MAEKENKIILYKDEEGKVSVNTRFADEDVWLTQAQLVEIYQSSKSNISEHLKNIFEDKELDQDSVVRKFRTTAADGKSYNSEQLPQMVKAIRYCITISMSLLPLAIVFSRLLPYVSVAGPLVYCMNISRRASRWTMND